MCDQACICISACMCDPPCMCGPACMFDPAVCVIQLACVIQQSVLSSFPAVTHAVCLPSRTLVPTCTSEPHALHACMYLTCRSPPRRCTIIATQPVEYLRIPRTALVNVLPASTVDALHKRIVSQQARAALQSSSTAGKAVVRWPQAAAQLREYLMNPPGSRPQWQVRFVTHTHTHTHTHTETRTHTRTSANFAWVKTSVAGGLRHTHTHTHTHTARTRAGRPQHAHIVALIC